MLYNSGTILFGVIFLGFSLAGNSAADSKSVWPRYLTLQERLAGQELSKKEAASLLGIVKKSLLGNGDNSSDSELCNRDEDAYLEIERQMLNQFFQKLSERDWAGARKNMAEKAVITGGFFEKSRKIDDYNIFTWSQNKQNSISGLFSEFKKIESLDFETILIKILKGKRKENGLFEEAILRIDLDIRGTSSGGERVQASGYAYVTVEKNNSVWKISEIKLDDGKSISAARSPSFKKLSNQKIFDQRFKAYIRSEAIRRGGYALAVNDYDGDNKADIYIGNARASQVFKNNGDMTFSLDKKMPVETLVKSAAFADFNNDGKQDLLLVRFVADDSGNKLKAQTAVSIYKNVGDGKFEKIENPIANNFRNENRAMPAALADFDNDGFLDFYVGYPGVQDFTHPIADASPYSHGLYFGSKQFLFTPLATESYQETFSNRNTAYPHSAIAADYNDDNLMDLLVVDDRGGLSTAFANKGNRRFKQEAEEIGVGNHGYGMAISMADLNHDGIMDLVLTNVETAASQRIEMSCHENHDQDIGVFKEKPLRVFLGNAKYGFQEVAPNKLGLDRPGYGLSGIRFLDFDNDGKLDLYVTNGLWSGTDKTQKFDSYFTRSHERLRKLGLAHGKQASLQRSLTDRPQSVYMDILSFYRGDIFNQESDVEIRPSLAGFQRKRLYKNFGDEFVDVGYLEGVDSIADGYMAASADLNNDGKVDLILRNADPGSDDVKFDPVEIFVNATPNDNSLTLQLRGAASNRDGIGAKVEVTVNGATNVQNAIGLDGTVQTSKNLHFGLGKASTAERVKVQWPSGKISVLNNLKKGFHILAE